MTAEQLDRIPEHLARPQGLDITVRTGSGAGRTTLSAFDRALQGAGVADFNLITLSSVIPTGSRIRTVDAALPGGHGDALFCVRSQAFADTPGETVWAGLGWCTDASGGGLFVEHRGTTEQSVVDQIEGSLADMNEDRGGGYGQVQIALSSATCVVQPVCALVLAAYRVSSWNDGHRAELERPASSDPRQQPVEPVEPAPVRPRAGTISPLKPRPAAPTPAAAASSRPGKDLGPVTVSVERSVDEVTARRFYGLYQEAFADLETQAVARQLLHEEEFLEEMTDPRVIKYVAWNDAGDAIGLTTLTSELSTVPWISPAYFAHHYPEHYARGAVYYLGLTLVHPDYRGDRTYQAMFIEMSDLVIGGRAVVAWDMCAANDDRGFMRDGAEFVARVAEATVEVVDQQQYYVGTFFGPPEGDPARTGPA